MRSRNPELAERRRDSRRLCSELIAISWRDHNGQELTEHANLEDLSRHGLSFSSSFPVAPGRPVRLEAPGFIVEGRVTRCQRCDYDYIVALEFTPGSEWDPERWTPAHLLTLPTTGER